MNTLVEPADFQLALLLGEYTLLLVLGQLSVVPCLVLIGHRFEWGFQLLRESLPLLIDCLLLPVACDKRVLLLQNLLELGDEEIVRLHRLLRLLILIILTLRVWLVWIIQSFGTALAFI